MYVFKSLTNNKPVDLIPYVENYLAERPECKMYIGCDSQNKRDKTEYAIVIVLHNNNSGGHVLFTKVTLPRVRDKFYRLFSEAAYSLEVATYIRELTGRSADFIDVDLNPDPRYHSNTVLSQAMGMIEGSGFEARCKPDALSATYAADKLCK